MFHVLIAPLTRQSLVGLLVLIASGCGQNNFGEDITIPQSKLHAVNVVLASQKAFSFPNDQLFNVADPFRRSRGPATATATAAKTGSASCIADASQGGEASAEFQIGHVISHTGDRAFDATVTFDIEYDCTFNNNGPPQAQPLSLKVYIMDSNRKALARMLLADAQSDRLPDRWSGSQTPSFDITFEPGLAYHLIVAGRVEVIGAEAAGPTAAINVRSLNIQVTPAPN